MKEIKARIGLEGGKEIKATFEDLDKALDDLAKGLSRSGEEAGQGFDDTVEKTRELKAAMRQLGVTTDESLRKQADALRASLKAVEESNASVREKEAAQEAGAKKLEALYRRMGQEGEDSAEQVADAYKRLGLTMSEDVEKEAREIRAAFERIRDSGTASADDVADAQKRMTQQLRELEERTGRSVTRFGQLRMQLADLRSAVVGVGAAIAGAAAAVGVLVGGTARDADNQIKTARAMGLTVTEYGRLTHALEQSGLSAEQSRQVLAKTAQSAKEAIDAEREGGEERNKALKKVAEANAEYDKAMQKSRALAAQASKLSGKARESALKEAEKAARDAEKAAKDMAKAQEDVAEAGAKAASPLRDLGIAVRDASDEVRGTKDILLDLSAVFQKMPNGPEKTALAMKLFGEEAGPRMVNLLNSGRDAIEALGDEAERLGIVFDDQAGNAAEAYNDAMDSLGKAFRGLRNEVGMALLGPLTSLIRGFTDLFLSFRENFPVLSQIVAVVGALAAGIIPLVAALGFLTTGVAGLAPLLGPLAAAFAGLGTAIGVVTAGVKALTLAVMTNPLGLLLVLVAAAVVAIIVYWDEIKAGAVAAWDAVVLAAQVAVAALTVLFSKAVEAAVAAWAGIQAGWQAVVDWLGGLYDTVLAALTAPFEAAAEAIKGIWDGVMGWISDAIDAVKSFLSLSSKTDAKSGGGGKGYAGGGEVVGPGTGTSDSIVSWLSNGEFVIKAAAVRRYGKTLFHRLNNMAVPPMPAFAGGGLVGSLPGPAPLPLLSADLGGGGGGGQSGTPVNLYLDGQRIGGIRAAGDPFEDLQRAGRFRVAPPSRHTR